MTESRDDEFDMIVKSLDMHLNFPNAEQSTEGQPESETPDFDDLPDDPEDQFYRNVPATNLMPRDRRSLLAGIAVIGSPATLVVCTVFDLWLPGMLVVALGLSFVAGAVWLFAQLPEHGPGRSDWPDDGAEL